MENQPKSEVSSTEQKRTAAPQTQDKRFNKPPNRNLQRDLKTFTLKEKDWFQELVEEKLPIFIRKSDGTNIENLTLSKFDIDEGRKLECLQNGEPIAISKLDCVFIAKMAHREEILNRIKKDEKQLPRLTYLTPEEEERWLFPQTTILRKMQQNLGGIFILTDGFMYRGRVYWFTRWNIFLSMAKDVEIFIFKHACARWSIMKGKRPSPSQKPPFRKSSSYQDRSRTPSSSSSQARGNNSDVNRNYSPKRK